LEDAIAEDEERKKKEKNPLDLLPPSTMILDALKRAFFAEKPSPPPSWFQDFWGKFDRPGFCLYMSDYKFNEENTVSFMTNNLINGFIQRAEECRKYAFGVVNMVGKDEETGPFKISGAWVFRGPEVPREMKNCPDADNFIWIKLDIDNPAHRRQFEDQFLAATLNGETLLDRKYFK